jgi:hypothetical protein
MSSFITNGITSTQNFIKTIIIIFVLTGTYFYATMYIVMQLCYCVVDTKDSLCNSVNVVSRRSTFDGEQEHIIFLLAAVFRLALRPSAHPYPIDTGVKVCTGPGLVQMAATKRKKDHFKLRWDILLSERKTIRSCGHLMLVTQSGLRKQIWQISFPQRFSQLSHPRNTSR